MEISMNLLPESERKSASIKGLDTLPFGQLRSDHMFMMNYRDGEWVDARIAPYAPIEILPGAMCLHYGQAIFEGAKAFRHENGDIHTFRIEENAKRMNVSGDIMCIPEVPVDMQVEGIMKLIDVEREWCPEIPESSLYIRPFIFATEDALGVRPSNEYIYCVILSPSGPYYAGGFSNAVRLLVTETYHRAVPGGTGAAKACGNYAASFRAGIQAGKYEAQQVLYLDHNNEFLEEVGAMNHFHIMKDGTVVVPEFTDTILKSITSISVMELLKDMGYNVRQERIKITDFVAQLKSGEIIEAGGFGTAAVITPVGEYIFENGDVITVGDGGIGENTRKIYEAYTNIQKGIATDKFGWLRKC